MYSAICITKVFELVFPKIISYKQRSTYPMKLLRCNIVKNANSCEIGSVPCEFCYATKKVDVDVSGQL